MADENSKVSSAAIERETTVVQFPLVHSAEPGTLHLTNELIAEILDAEDVEALHNDWKKNPAS